jgi:flap endonuclease-1
VICENLSRVYQIVNASYPAILMGVLLTPIIAKQTHALADFRGARLAVDGPGELYQFLALIRVGDGTPLRDRSGRTTSHLSGLFYRTTRLMADHALSLVFVFDGAPPLLKAAELARRRGVRDRYEQERSEAARAGDLPRAYSKGTMTSRLSREMVDEARQLLRLMGLPTVQAPSEAEAQAAHMAASGDVWAAVSKDYDTLLFGAPRFVRFLTVSGREFLPSQGTSRPIVPELVVLEEVVERLQITREQLIDLAILVGTDFNDGVKGIGPKKALGLVRQYGRIEDMPGDIQGGVENIDEIRRIYLDPEVTDEYDLTFGRPDVPGIIDFLCEQRAFSKARVMAALERAFGSDTTPRLIDP